jgi:hypothetical protein
MALAPFIPKPAVTLWASSLSPHLPFEPLDTQTSSVYGTTELGFALTRAFGNPRFAILAAGHLEAGLCPLLQKAQA